MILKPCFFSHAKYNRFRLCFVRFTLVLWIAWETFTVTAVCCTAVCLNWNLHNQEREDKKQTEILTLVSHFFPCFLCVRFYTQSKSKDWDSQTEDFCMCVFASVLKIGNKMKPGEPHRNRSTAASKNPNYTFVCPSVCLSDEIHTHKATFLVCSPQRLF